MQAGTKRMLPKDRLGVCILPRFPKAYGTLWLPLHQGSLQASKLHLRVKVQGFDLWSRLLKRSFYFLVLFYSLVLRLRFSMGVLSSLEVLCFLRFFSLEPFMKSRGDRSS